MLVLGFADYAAPARRLAQALDLPYREVALHRFPDGESRLTLPVPLPAQVIVVRSLDQPNAKLVELMLAAETARRHGARRLTLVAPYLCYMRQDAEFHPGEAVSQPIVGRFLGGLFDAVVTVDPHLHRTGTLAQAIPNARTLAVSAGPLLGDWIRSRWGAPLLIGPDAESEQWVARIAGAIGAEHAIARKERFGDREVRVTLPGGIDVAGRAAVLIDDMASTGRTLIEAAHALQARGAGALHALVTHALLDGQAEAELAAAGIGSIGASDSVPHAASVVELAPLLAEAVRSLA